MNEWKRKNDQFKFPQFHKKYITLPNQACPSSLEDILIFVAAFFFGCKAFLTLESFRYECNFGGNSPLSFRQSMVPDYPISNQLLYGIVLNGGLWARIQGGWCRNESLRSWGTTEGPGWKLWYWLGVCFKGALSNADGTQRDVFLPSAYRHEFRPYCPDFKDIFEFFTHC